MDGGHSIGLARGADGNSDSKNMYRWLAHGVQTNLEKSRLLVSSSTPSADGPFADAFAFTVCQDHRKSNKYVDDALDMRFGISALV